MSEPASLPVSLRVITRADGDAFSFAVHSWLSDAKGRIPYNLIDGDDYWGTRDAPGLDHHTMIENALDHPATITLLAHVADEPDLFVGWACVEPRENALHYVYVKRDARHAGVFTALLAGAAERGIKLGSVRFSSLPELGPHDARWTNVWKSRGWRYTPHLLWGLR